MRVILDMPLGDPVALAISTPAAAAVELPDAPTGSAELDRGLVLGAALVTVAERIGDAHTVEHVEWHVRELSRWLRHAVETERLRS